MTRGHAELLLRRRFSATHRILVNGELEPTHGHDFVVEVAFEAAADAERRSRELDALLAELSHGELAPVTRSQGGHPSAERLAAHVFQQLAARRLRVLEVSVQEAPGCWARVRASAAH